jgi:hypothetical protein
MQTEPIWFQIGFTIDYDTDHNIFKFYYMTEMVYETTEPGWPWFDDRSYVHSIGCDELWTPDTENNLEKGEYFFGLFYTMQASSNPVNTIQMSEPDCGGAVYC